jgi:hypothetical protein
MTGSWKLKKNVLVSNKNVLVMLCAAALAFPAGATAQGFGAAARAGTFGLGAEAAIGLGSHLAIRGGGGVLPFEYNSEFDGVAFSIGAPKTAANVGIDLFPSSSGAFRLSVGALFRSNILLTGELTQPAEIGNRTFTSQELGTLSGEVAGASVAPYGTIGFGRHQASGLGFFFEVGAAMMGEPTVTLASTGGTMSSSNEMNDQLRAEETRAEDDMGAFLKFHPIINFGVSFGLGGGR